MVKLFQKRILFFLVTFGFAWNLPSIIAATGTVGTSTGIRVDSTVILTLDDMNQQNPAKPLQLAAPAAQDDDSGIRTAIINTAYKYIGADYAYGGQTPPAAFDCSGLVNQVYRDAANISIPRSSSGIWTTGRKINANQLKPGDIIVFADNGRTPNHVAIYVDSTYMIHSVSAGNPSGVVLSKHTDGSWSRKILGYVTFL